MKLRTRYVLFAAVLLLAACENTEEEINALNKRVSMSDQAIKVESYLSQGGKVKAKLTAPVMLRVQADTVYTEFPKTLHVDFYNDSARVESRLDSKYGKYMESVNMIYLRDSVRVTTVKGDTLYCQDLWWDQNKQIFYTHKPARFVSSTGEPLQGDGGLIATQDLKEKTFINSHGQFSPGETGLPGKAGAVAPAAAGTAAPADTTGRAPAPAAPPPAK
ncbi:LPS export ABC transporter periplasmic protein LptC [Niabella drilacis]|uniref:LPS export ABC transporter protein LptC n=1 Tax=Niabella drilacis (strain DSM 25811 / CCM 8410 / CCUG 62505 / LMG 26954 / E90) TaxID=1285928 RepID=A0A1G6PHR8_NIADE|nr:LPS export ABC transporter periplasmic protein LptC [Niabella drilacis]SDC79782.1 LPS export ABC transporter protein LptC [Niabella drilacis]